MFRKFGKLILIFTFFFNSFNIYLALNPEIKNIVCDANPKICQQYVFDTTMEKDNFKTVTISCFFEEPINTFSVKITLLKQNSGKYNKLVENTVDMCQTGNKSSEMAFAVKFRQEISKYGNNVDKCPLQGNVSLVNIPITQLPIFPFFIPHGVYRLIFFLKDTTRNEAMLQTTTDVLI